MPRVLSAFALGCGFVMTASAPVLAQTSAGGATLSWTRGEGADGCPAQDRVQLLVRGRLGRDPFQPPAAQAVEAFVTRDGAVFRAALFVRNASGALVARRELRSTSPECTALAEAAALAIAVAIDPDAALRPHEASSSPPPPASSSPAPSASSPPPADASASASPAPVSSHEPALSSSPPPGLPRRTVARATRPRRPVHDVIASAALNYGLLPGVAAGVRLRVDAWAYSWFRAGTGALLLPETTIAQQGHSFAFGLTAFDLTACGDLLRRTRMSLTACAGVWLGVVHSVVYDLLPVHPGDHFWAAASAEANWRVTVAGPVVAELGIGGVMPLTRYQFRVEGPLGVIYEQNWVALLATVGIGVRIP